MLHRLSGHSRTAFALWAWLGLLAALPAQSQTRLEGLSLSNDEPIQIESDRLDVDDAAGTAVFTGNVQVVQGDTTMKSGLMTVYYVDDGSGSAATGSSDIERIEVRNKVYISSGTQEATGDEGTFDMIGEVLTLSGDRVVLSDGPNVVVGCKITVQMKTGQARVERCANDRIILQLDPKSKPKS